MGTSTVGVALWTVMEGRWWPGLTRDGSDTLRVGGSDKLNSIIHYSLAGIPRNWHFYNLADMVLCAAMLPAAMELLGFLL